MPGPGNQALSSPPPQGGRAAKYGGRTHWLVLASDDKIRLPLVASLKSARAEALQLFEQQSQFLERDERSFNEALRKCYPQEFEDLSQARDLLEQYRVVERAVIRESQQSKAPLPVAWVRVQSALERGDESILDETAQAESQVELALPEKSKQFGDDHYVQQWVRRLYLRYVKEHHPDRRKGLSEEELQHWHRVQNAYKQRAFLLVELMIRDLGDEDTGVHQCDLAELRAWLERTKQLKQDQEQRCAAWQKEPAWGYTSLALIDRGRLVGEMKGRLEGIYSKTLEEIEDLQHQFKTWAQQAKQKMVIPARKNRKRIPPEQRVFRFGEE